MNKGWRIMTRWNHQPHWVIRPFGQINLHQPLTQCMNSYPHNGVGLGVKGRPAAQCFHRDRVFLDVIRAALEVLLTDVLEHSRDII